MTKAESAASRTPRTDKVAERRTVIKDNGRIVTADYVVNADFARTLELEAADLREQLSVSERNLAYAAKEITDLREQLAAEIANRRDGHRLLIEERGVRDVCNDCCGLGTKSYGSTATWRGGGGGQAFTTDVCNKCWGSGDSGRKWPSHSEIQSLRERLAKAREPIEADARRYRWLAGNAPQHSSRWPRWRLEFWSGFHGGWQPLTDTELDAAIDAAIAREGGEDE